MVEHGQNGETFATIVIVTLDAGFIGAVVHLACDEGEVGVADFHTTVAVGAGGIANAGEEDVGSVGCGVIVGVEASIAENGPAGGYRSTYLGDAHTLVVSIAGEVLSVGQGVDGGAEFNGFGLLGGRKHGFHVVEQEETAGRDGHKVTIPYAVVF